MRRWPGTQDGFGLHMKDVSEPDDEILRNSRIDLFVLEMFYIPSLSFSKLAVLAFYWRIFNSVRSAKISIIILAVIAILWLTARVSPLVWLRQTLAANTYTAAHSEHTSLYTSTCLLGCSAWSLVPLPGPVVLSWQRVTPVHTSACRCCSSDHTCPAGAKATAKPGEEIWSHRPFYVRHFRLCGHGRRDCIFDQIRSWCHR